MRLRQPKLPEGTWDITVWDAPSYFEWTQKTGGTTSVAGHRVEALGEGRARLTLTLDMLGFLIPITALFYKKHTPKNRLLTCANTGRRTRGAHKGKIANRPGTAANDKIQPAFRRAKAAILAVTHTRKPSPAPRPPG